MRPGLAPRFETVAKCNAIFLKALFFGLSSNQGRKKRCSFRTIFDEEAFTLGNTSCNSSPQFCYDASCANIVHCRMSQNYPVLLKFVVVVGLKRTCRTDLGTGNDISVVVKCGASLSAN